MTKYSLLTVCHHKLVKHPFYAYNFIGTRYDCGTKIGFTKANTNFALKDDEIGKEYNDWLSSLIKN